MTRTPLRTAGIAVLLTLWSIGPAAAQAPAIDGGLQVGAAVGLAGASAPLEKGYDWALALQKPLTPLISIAVQSGASGLDVTPDSDVPRFPADTLRLYRVTAGGVMYPRGLEGVRIRPYLAGGGGLYRYTFAVDPAREVRFGVQAGFGLEAWPTERVAVTAEVMGRFVGSAAGTAVATGGVFSMGAVTLGVRARF